MRCAVRLLVAALATSMTLLSVGSAVAAPGSQRRCTVARHPHARVGKRTLIFGVHRSSAEGEPETVYFVCLRPRGPRIVLGVDGPNEDPYGPAGTTRGFVIAGTYVAAHESAGEASSVQCVKYQRYGCPSPEAWIEVVDARSRRSASVSVPFVDDPRSFAPLDLPLALSDAGALAWLQPRSAGGYELWGTVLTPRGGKSFRTSPAMIDSGNISPGSLRFTHGRTVSWTKDGISHSATLT